MQMACVMLEKDDTNWFAEIDVDTHRIQEIIGQIFSLYEMCKTFNEKREIQRLLAKMPKPKMQPSVRFFFTCKYRLFRINHIARTNSNQFFDKYVGLHRQRSHRTGMQLHC